MRMVVSVFMLIAFTGLLAQTQAEVIEANGEPDQPHARSGQRILRDIPPGGLLLIPESNLDRVMAFDPITGNLIDENWLLESAANELSTPIEAILSPDGTQIWVSDQVADGVLAYDLEGNYIDRLAPAGGVNTAILNNVRGIGIKANGNLLVTSASTPSSDVIAEFDASGTFLGNFIGPDTNVMDGPWDIVYRSAQNDYLVNASDTDEIARYDATGAYQGVFASIAGMHEQMTQIANGNIITANFSSPYGVNEFAPDGSLVGVYHAGISGLRGCYELPNGHFLITNGSGVYEIDRDNNLIDTKVSGTYSCRFISLVQPQVGLGVPQNPRLSVSGNTVTLTWQAVDGAVTYNLYSHTDPYAAIDQWTHEVTVADTTWSTAAPNDKTFYLITASDEGGE